MNVLVTGGAGFIGSHVAEAYLTRGNRVTIVDNLSTGVRENVPEGAVFVNADIKDGTLDELFAREEFNLVNHHAAQIDVRKSVADTVYDVEVNVLGSVRLLELCRKYQVKNFIFASTGGAIYGEQQMFPAGEDHLLSPVSPYGVAKLAVEKYMYWYALQFGMNCTALRYANVYGPRQNPFGEAGVVAIFTRKMIDGDQPIIYGDGKQTRDYVYISDVVRADMLAGHLQGFHTINIGTAIEMDVNELFQRLNQLFGGRYKGVHGPAKPGEQSRSCVDPSLAKKLLGWVPEVSVEEGFKRTVDYFK